MKWLSPNVKQTWVALPCLLIKIAFGMSLSFTTCFIAAVQKPDSIVKMDLHALTWFASSMGFFAIIGAIAGSCMMSKYGRRKSSLITVVPGIIGQLIIVFSADINYLILGRVLLGMTLASTVQIGLVYVGECMDPHSRAMFLNMSTAALNFGNILVHTIGHYVTWKTLALINCIPTILFFLVMYTCPESPSWLADQKQFMRSRDTFYWLRGKTEETTREIEELIRSQGKKQGNKTLSENAKHFFKKFQKKNFWKPFGVTTVSTALLEVSGRHIFPSYSGQILQEILPKEVDLFYYNVAIDVIILFSGILVIYLVKLMRMRTLLFTTGAATSVLLSLASLSLYLVKNDMIPRDYTWLSLVLFALYFSFTNLGCTSVPVALAGEIFPLEHRGLLSVLCTLVSLIYMIIGLKTMPFLILAVNIYGAFGIFAMMLVVLLIILYFTLPETKGKSLQEIEECFCHGHISNRNIVPTDDVNVDMSLLKNNVEATK